MGKFVRSGLTGQGARGVRACAQPHDARDLVQRREAHRHEVVDVFLTRRGRQTPQQVPVDSVGDADREHVGDALQALRLGDGGAATAGRVGHAVRDDYHDVLHIGSLPKPRVQALLPRDTQRFWCVRLLTQELDGAQCVFQLLSRCVPVHGEY